MTKDLTAGKPFRLILAFFVPMLAGNLFQQFYSIADTIIIGKFVGVEALAALGSTGSLSFLVVGFATGVCSGICIPVAQRFGAQEMHEMRRCAANAVYVAASITVALTALVVPLTERILIWMNTPADIFEGAHAYISVIFGGMGATILYNLLANLSRALGNSKTPLYFLILASILNVGLDLVFILAFHLGVSGAAYATVIAQGISGLLCLVYMRKAFPELRITREEWRPDFPLMGQLLWVGLPMALQFSITAIGSITLQGAVNSFGSRVVASVAAASKVGMLLTQPFDAMGATMANYCGQNVGAAKVGRVLQGVRQSLLAVVGYGLVMWAVATFAGTTVARLFIDKGETDILGLVHEYLFCNGMFFWMLGILMVLRCSLQGMGFALPAMMAGVFELAARSAVALYFVARLGFPAVCFANPAAWLAANLLLVPVYLYAMRVLRQRYPAEQQAVSVAKA